MADPGQRDPSGQPLDEAWWEHREPEAFPPDHAPILAAYEKTRPGFEILLAAGCPGCDLFFKDLGEGLAEVCLWNIWEQKEDPADSDEDKRKINQMQQALGVLSDGDRYLRLQIACLQRCYWEFPSNVDLILGGIASGKVDLDGDVSCEPPWTIVLWVLRHRRGDAAPDVRVLGAQQRLARAYMTILTWWTFSADLSQLKRELPEHADLADTIYRRLGPPEERKALYVGKLHAALGWQAFPSAADLGERKEICDRLMDAYDVAIQQELGETKDVIGGLIEPQDLCHHAFFRRVDHQIANIGAGRPVSLPGAGEERRRIHEAVTNYVHALGSWLAGRTVEEAASIWPPSEETARRVYDLLGPSSPRKRWLVACLWKKLLDNQAQHGRGALDEEPARFALPPHALAAH